MVLQPNLKEGFIFTKVTKMGIDFIGDIMKNAGEVLSIYKKGPRYSIDSMVFIPSR